MTLTMQYDFFTARWLSAKWSLLSTSHLYISTFYLANWGVSSFLGRRLCCGFFVFFCLLLFTNRRRTYFPNYFLSAATFCLPLVKLAFFCLYAQRGVGSCFVLTLDFTPRWFCCHNQRRGTATIRTTLTDSKTKFSNYIFFVFDV
jgi:hypothetical protein